MKYTVFDIETDGFLDVLTKTHCLSYQSFNFLEKTGQGTITDLNEIVQFLNSQEILVGHFITGFDVPAIEKLTGVKLKVRVIDTLGISWYLNPFPGFKHGLEAWGDRLGVQKPPIKDWESLTLQEYIFRCESDVEINTRLFHKQIKYLNTLYEGNYNPIMDYLTYKMKCLREQSEEGITLNKRLCEESKANLDFELESKVEILAALMPRIVTKTIPKKPFKKDGSLSAHGVRWQALLKEYNLPEDTVEITELGNPGSHSQLKSWLFTCDWKPKTFKESKATGERIPQVSLPFGGGICPSVIELYKTVPDLKELEGFFVIKHRIGLFKSFIEAEAKRNTGKVYATAHGFTNTLRLQHSKPIVNLPGVGKFYGTELRGSLTVPDDSYTMIGSDISGLEDNTKMHWMYFFDPDYVNTMRVPGFDGHIDIAVFAGLMSELDAAFYKDIAKRKDEEGEDFVYYSEEEKNEFARLSKVRSNAKTVNFGGVYGIGPAKLAEQLKITLDEAYALHTAYWERNHAVKKVANGCRTRAIGNYTWLYNPISKFWYFLKNEKDKFSTLNQGSGVFVFDTWVYHVRKKAIKILLQYHDELLTMGKNEQAKFIAKKLQEAMDETNALLKLNVTIRISIDFGKNYADCH